MPANRPTTQTRRSRATVLSDEDPRFQESTSVSAAAGMALPLRCFVSRRKLTRSRALQTEVVSPRTRSHATLLTIGRDTLPPQEKLDEPRRDGALPYLRVRDYRH